MDYIIVKKKRDEHPYYCGGYTWTSQLGNPNLLILRTYDEALLRCRRINETERKTPVYIVSKKSHIRKLKLKKIYENRINS